MPDKPRSATIHQFGGPNVHRAEFRPPHFPVPASISRSAPGIFDIHITVMLDSDNKKQALDLSVAAMDAITRRLSGH